MWKGTFRGESEKRNTVGMGRGEGKSGGLENSRHKEEDEKGKSVTEVRTDEKVKSQLKKR